MSLELQRFQETLRDHARRNDNATALWGDTLKLDYATLYAEVLYRQERLRDEQVQVIALALDNGVDAMLWDLAVLFEGLTCVTLPPFFSAAQRAHCLEQSQAERVIAEPELDAELLAAGYEQRGEFWCRAFSGPSRMPAGTAKLTFTSGTTGTPKGVCLSADSLLRVARELDQASEADRPAASSGAVAVGDSAGKPRLLCRAVCRRNAESAEPENPRHSGRQRRRHSAPARLSGQPYAGESDPGAAVAVVAGQRRRTESLRPANPALCRCRWCAGLARICCTVHNGSGCRFTKVTACPNAPRWCASIAPVPGAPAASADRCRMLKYAWPRTAKC